MLPSCALANIVENHKPCPQSIDVPPSGGIASLQTQEWTDAGAELQRCSLASPGMLGALLPGVLPGIWAASPLSAAQQTPAIRKSAQTALLRGLVLNGAMSPRGWGAWLHSCCIASYFSPSPSPHTETERVAVHRSHLPVAILRSPEQSKASAGGGSDNCIEPVSPPDGVGEAEHAKSATYPILYREGEQLDQRYCAAIPTLTSTQSTTPSLGPIPAELEALLFAALIIVQRGQLAPSTHPRSWPLHCSS